MPTPVFVNATRHASHSRKALATYLACQETATKLRRMFTTAQLETIREFDN